MSTDETIDILGDSTDGEDDSKPISPKEIQEMLDSDLNCAICRDLYINPLILNCSHSFCKFCVFQWLSKQSKCPTCRVTVTFQAENLALRNIINRMIAKSTTQYRLERVSSVDKRLRDEEKQQKDGVVPRIDLKPSTHNNNSTGPRRIRTNRLDNGYAAGIVILADRDGGHVGEIPEYGWWEEVPGRSHDDSQSNESSADEGSQDNDDDDDDDDDDNEEEDDDDDEDEDFEEDDEDDEDDDDSDDSMDDEDFVELNVMDNSDHGSVEGDVGLFDDDDSTHYIPSIDSDDSHSQNSDNSDASESSMSEDEMENEDDDNEQNRGETTYMSMLVSGEDSPVSISDDESTDEYDPHLSSQDEESDDDDDDDDDDDEDETEEGSLQYEDSDVEFATSSEELSDDDY